MNVLILGSGAREHALAAAVAGSPMLDRLLVAPGNPGCEAVAHVAPLDLAGPEHVSFLANSRYARAAARSAAGICFSRAMSDFNRSAAGA